MIDTKTLDDFARAIAAMMPDNLAKLRQELEKHLRVGLESFFQEIDLVTREEYDVQVALLARTREKLERLETRINELEKTSDISQSTTRSLSDLGDRSEGKTV